MQGSVFGSRRSLFGTEAEVGGVDLNLTPLMDVMSNILFFLLASVGAAVVALLPASVPTRSESAGGQEPPPSQVLVTLQITRRGILGSAANERLSREQTAALRFELPRRTEAGAPPWDLPYEELTRRLAAIKDRYPASDTVILLPDNEVPYEVIIRTMDAARGTGGTARTSNLFTKVVISDLVR
ncbi:MAG: biopolymer transporter ExbD [Myxococcales bacterium]|nr:biopolymer transporter ExbD [Myxococcota bacterium]MDW8282013.1 biopolymer transporter ExbD [Myxococcales bacterium]